jgi:hypothetical protein
LVKSVLTTTRGNTMAAMMPRIATTMSSSNSENAARKLLDRFIVQLEKESCRHHRRANLPQGA